MPLALYTTLPDEASAKALAQKAVTANLAACVQMERIASVYLWEGVQEDDEIRLLFKTTDAASEALTALILREHPYDEPALWSHAIDGAPGYLRWIEASTQGR